MARLKSDQILKCNHFHNSESIPLADFKELTTLRVSVRADVFSVAPMATVSKTNHTRAWRYACGGR